MIAQLVAIVLEFWRFLAFWAVLDQENLGFIRRLGRPHRDMHAGLNWKCPILERAETEDARSYVYILDPCSLRSVDGKALVLRLSVTCRVINARKYFLTVCDGRTNVQDVAAGELGDVVAASEADDVLSGAVLPIVLQRTRKAARRWGMRIDDVKLVDAAETTSYRLWQSNFTSTGQD